MGAELDDRSTTMTAAAAARSPPTPATHTRGFAFSEACWAPPEAGASRAATADSGARDEGGAVDVRSARPPVDEGGAEMRLAEDGEAAVNLVEEVDRGASPSRREAARRRR